MWLRRAYFWWMFPAALVLPLWLLIGSIAFSASAWAVLVLVFAIPSVFVGQLVLALLVRARGTVRASRAVSWWDVLGFTVWHASVVATGLFITSWFAVALVLAVVGGIGLFWLTIWQLWHETTGSVRAVLRTADGTGYIPPQHPRTPAPPVGDVIIVPERRPED